MFSIATYMLFVLRSILHGLPDAGPVANVAAGVWGVWGLRRVNDGARRTYRLCLALFKFKTTLCSANFARESLLFSSGITHGRWTRVCLCSHIKCNERWCRGSEGERHKPSNTIETFEELRKLYFRQYHRFCASCTQLKHLLKSIYTANNAA